MLEKTAASLEPCGFHRVVPGATQSFRSMRQLRNTFWQHGAADVELTTAWQALMHGISDLNMASSEERKSSSTLSASTFLLDFLYPSGAINLMRRLTLATPVSGRPNGFCYGRRLTKLPPRLYTPSLVKRHAHRSSTEPTTNPEAQEPGSSTSDNQADVTPIRDTEATGTAVTGDITVGGTVQEAGVGEASKGPDIAVGHWGHSDMDDDHAEALENLLRSGDSEDVDRVWYHYQALDQPSQATYLERVLAFVSRSGRLSDSWKISELFRKLPPSQWTDHIFVAGVGAEINLQNTDQALELFIKGLDHISLRLPSLVEALDLLLATALRSSTPELLKSIWRHYPKMVKRWDFEGILSQFQNVASVPSLAVLKDVWNYYPRMAGRWNFEGITGQLKHVALVPGLAEKALEFRTRGREELYEPQDPGLGQEALDALQRILVRRALVSCADAQVIPLLGVTRDPFAFEEFLRGVIYRGKEKLGVEVYRIYRDLPGSKPSHPVLHEIFKAYLNLIVPISVKYAGLEMLWGDWYRFHTIPSFRAFQRHLAFYASRGDTYKVYELWPKFVELYRDSPKIPVLEADDLFAHLLQVHAVRGEVEETQRIFDDVTNKFRFEPVTHHWNILLNAYVKAGDYDSAITTFERVIAAGKSDKYTYGTMMQMAGDRGDLGFTIDLYRQGLEAGVRINDAILSSLVDAYCLNDRFQAAETVCVRAARKGIIRTWMWNKLIYYHALRRDLAAVNKVLNDMVKYNIPYNQFTYRELLLGLSLCRQSLHALNLLGTALRDNIFEVTAEHFHLVMSALLVTGEPAAAQRLDKMMQDYGFPSSSESLFLLTQSLGQWRNLPVRQRARLTPAQWLGETFRSFYRIYGLNDRQRLSQLPPPNPRRSQAGELLGKSTEKYHFSTMISMLTELKDFAGARELVDLYRYVFQGQKGMDGILPAEMLNSLMRADFQEKLYDRVIATWELLFETAKKEARSADYIEGQPDTPKISARYRYILSSGLDTMQKLLFDRGDAAGIQSLVREVRAQGFELDSKNWNYYIQALAQLKVYKEAFVACEKMLMPNWTGWFVVRAKQNVKENLPLDVRRKGSTPRHLRPLSATLYRLAQSYMELDRLGPWSADAAATAQEIEKDCVQVVRAIKSMIRVHSKLESEIFGEDDYAGFDFDDLDYEKDSQVENWEDYVTK